MNQNDDDKYFIIFAIEFLIKNFLEFWHLFWHFGIEFGFWPNFGREWQFIEIYKNFGQLCKLLCLNKPGMASSKYVGQGLWGFITIIKYISYIL